jgi:hypothetical protein
LFYNIIKAFVWLLSIFYLLINITPSFIINRAHTAKV